MSSEVHASIDVLAGGQLMRFENVRLELVGSWAVLTAEDGSKSVFSADTTFSIDIPAERNRHVE